MAIEGDLQAAAAAINELRESLEEDSITPITVSGSTAAFKVQDNSSLSFTATFSGASLPCPCVLAVTGGGSAKRGLVKANARLAGGATLGQAVAAAGLFAAVDLDWVTECEDGACLHAGASFGLVQTAAAHCLCWVVAAAPPAHPSEPPAYPLWQAAAVTRIWRKLPALAPAAMRMETMMSCCGSGPSAWSSE